MAGGGELETTLGPARELYDALNAFQVRPLTGEAYDAYYYGGLTKAKGGVAARIHVALIGAERGGPMAPLVNEPARAYLIGTSGSGKSTAMETLRRQAGNEFVFLTISAKETLDVLSFEPFDFFFVLATLAIERTRDLTERAPSDELLKKLRLWGSEITEKVMDGRDSELGAGAGIDAATPESPLNLLKLFASFRASLKITHSRTKETVLASLRQLNELSELTNQVLLECQELLRSHGHGSLVVLAEDFEKEDVSPESMRKLVVTYGSLLSRLPVHIVLSISRMIRSEVTTGGFADHTWSDAPIYDREGYLQGKLDEENVQHYLNLIACRAQPSLFEGDTLRAAVVSSGGHFTTLFRILHTAILNALVRVSEDSSEAQRVTEADMRQAIRRIRSDIRARLSPSPFDPTPLTPEEKIEALVRAHKDGPKSLTLDAIQQRLVSLNLILTHNETYWFSVHPLAVDYLVAAGRVEGGGGSLREYL